jgi:hypothetical protein
MSEQNDNSQREMSDDPNETEVMTAYAGSDDDFQEYDEFGDEAGLPVRPRRVLVNRWTAALAAVVIGGACFYAGVRVEKSQVSSTSTGAVGGGFAALASRFSAAGGASGASGAASRRGAAAAGFGGGGDFGGAGGFAGAAGGGTDGTISTINGDTLDITETSGNTVKVKLSDATTLTKTITVGKKSLFPGDTVSVTGSAGKGGTVTASALSDSGSKASSTSSSTSGSSGSASSSTSGASALQSLFGG